MKVSSVILVALVVALVVAKRGFCSLTECDDDKLLCFDGSNCYFPREVCDGHRDCDDSSDEANCTVAMECPGEQFTCPGGNECFPNSYKCDGNEDCDDGSDEENCTINCDINNEFKCFSDDQCINMMLVCDGTVDCHDASDEEGCSSECDESTEMSCNANVTQCFLLEHKCDGHFDCENDYDESDELCGDQGPGECASDNGGCEQVCINSHKGYHCDCHEGYHISFDHRSCQDNDECNQSGPALCSQICINSPGSYRCGCNEGYDLTSDNHTCVVADGVAPELWFINDGALVQYNMRSNNQRAVQLSGSVGAFDFDHQNSRVFWVDTQKNIINWMSTNGSNADKLTLSPMYVATSLAYDWVHNNVYWSQVSARSSGAKIEVLSVATKWRHVILNSSEVDNPRTMIVDPRSDQRYLYWGQAGNTPGIYRCGLDGADRRPLVNFDVVHPTGLTLDMVGKRILWLDSRKDILVAWYLKTSERVVLYTFTQYPRHPVGLAVFEGWMYWADSGTKSIYKLRSTRAVEHHGDIATVLSNVSAASGVHVVHAYQQPKAINLCESDNGRCSHHCLPSPTFMKRRCFCPDNDRQNIYELTSDGTCRISPVFSTTQSQSRPLWSVSKHMTNSPVGLPNSNGVFKPARVESGPTQGADSEPPSTPLGVWISVGIGIVVLLAGCIIGIMVCYRLYLKYSKHTINFESGVCIHKDMSSESALKALQVPLSSASATMEAEEHLETV